MKKIVPVFNESDKAIKIILKEIGLKRGISIKIMETFSEKYKKYFLH